jgi:hypothetical protein
MDSLLVHICFKAHVRGTANKRGKRTLRQLLDCESQLSLLQDEETRF